MDKPFEVKWVDEESGKTLKEKRIIKKLVSRRKVKKEYHYEVQWKNKTMDFNSWYPRETLRKRGFTKLITALDDKLAASQQDGYVQHRKNENFSKLCHYNRFVIIVKIVFTSSFLF